jgi:hypothetical protein
LHKNTGRLDLTKRRTLDYIKLTRLFYLEWNIFEDDDRVLGRVLFEQGLEVGRAGRQDHLVSLARLTVASLKQKKK